MAKNADGIVNRWIRHRSYTPILFVITALALWYFFQLLVRIVLTCLPGGDACLLGWAHWPLQMLVWPIPTPPKFLYDSARLDAIVSLLTLALALWPAVQIFFPPENLEVPRDDGTCSQTGTAHRHERMRDGVPLEM
jgi:hypothetical protein